MDLKEWTRHYVKNKDILKKELVDVQDKESSILFKYKDKEEEYHVQPILGKCTKTCEHTFYVCEAAEKNLEYLINNWKELVKEKICFIFVNLSKNTKWVIKPFVHDRIADPESLKLGLKTMFSEGLK